jgi:hypothetical protein
MFPGVTIGYTDIQAAKSHIKRKNESVQKECRKIIIEASNCKVYTFSNCAGPIRKCVHRLLGLVESYTSEEYKGKNDAKLYYHIFRLHAIHNRKRTLQDRPKVEIKEAPTSDKK